MQYFSTWRNQLLIFLNQCDPAFTAAHEYKVAPLAIAIFLKYNSGMINPLLSLNLLVHTAYFSDPVLVNLVQDIFRVLSQTEGCRQPLQQRLVPTLVSILDAQEGRVALGLKVILV